MRKMVPNIMKKIVLTGGGTAGHVTPNIALIPSLQKEGYDIFYIGSYSGIEKNLIKDLGIPYYGISSGKLRRYVDLKNITDPFRVIKGCYQAARILRKLKPDVVFSKGGFVTVPVILGAKLAGVPSIIHESDMTPGLANKISTPFASKICTAFPETKKYFPKEKVINTGTPIREELLRGNKNVGLNLCAFTPNKPILMIMGGSLGSVKINKALRGILPKLLNKYQVVHLCGKGNLDHSLDSLEGYKQFEYVKGDLPHLFAMADVIISRAGANAICELLALKKPNLLIPLSANASRGDQVLNAKSFNKHGYSYILDEDDMTETSLLKAINYVYENRNSQLKAMSTSEISNGVSNVLNVINSTLKSK